MKHLSLFRKIYLSVLAILALPAYGIYCFDLIRENSVMRQAEADFETRRAELAEVTREMAEDFERLADASASDDNREAILSWVRRRKLDSGMDIYVSFSDTEVPELFAVRVKSSGTRIAPPLAVTTHSESGRMTLYSVLEPYEDWDELRTPLPGRLFLWMLVAGTVGSYFVVRHLLVPLHELERATTRMAVGDFSARVDEAAVVGHDELRRLGTAFNSMAAEVERLLESQKRLLADVSHELRSPLQRLNVALALIGRNREMADDAIPLEQAKRDIRRIDAMVEELPTLTRAEASMGVEKEPVSLKELLTSLPESGKFEWCGEGRHIEFIGEDLYVRGDARLLSRAMRNVVSNAVRYSPPDGGIEITLTREGSESVLKVRDHGPGVAEEELEKIFLPFYRTESAQDKIKDGSGLGLPIVRRVAESHGGSCFAANAPGGGLVVTLRLPLYPFEENETAIKQNTSGV